MYKRTDALYVADIRESIEAILKYLQNGIAYNDFRNNRMMYSAVIREFEIIGKAVGKLSDSLKEEYPEMNWQDIKDFRYILAHEYFGIDLEIVWSVIQEDLPLLRDTINKILADKFS